MHVVIFFAMYFRTISALHLIVSAFVVYHEKLETWSFSTYITAEASTGDTKLKLEIVPAWTPNTIIYGTQFRARTTPHFCCLWLMIVFIWSKG